MPIRLLIGDNDQGIREAIAREKAKFEPSLLQLNCHQFEASSLQAALLMAQTHPLGATHRLIIITDCKFTSFNSFSDKDSERLQTAVIPETTLLLLVAKSIDRRLKLVKQVLARSTVQELNVASPWRTQEIAQEVMRQARLVQLNLTQAAVQYLADAIGNDYSRIAVELPKLKVYAQEQPLTLEQLQGLVPCQTQTSLQLADAVRCGQGDRIVQLVEDLQNEPPVRIVATLMTQFRTWLWVKAALSDTHPRKDWEIAKLCNLSNPKRLFYLRTEVAKLRLESLVQSLTLLFELDTGLKQGQGRQTLLPTLLQVAQLLRHSPYEQRN